MMLFIGRIAGISGIAFTGIAKPKTEPWSVAFLLGLVLGAAMFHLINTTPGPAFEVSKPLLVSGGLLVGVGTKLGNGCTSGHGICGLARFSARSLVAVVVFMISAIVTVFIRLHGGLA